MQTTGRNAVVDPTLAEPKLDQLSPAHHPMLPLRELRNCGVDSTRPSQPTYFVG
jgi:hypothetical protein